MPRAVHAGNYGLMQIRLGTARGVGYSGDAEGLLDPDTNLTYAVKYLAGAYRAAGCDADRAVSYYQRGYYGAALRECAESSALRSRRRRSRQGRAEARRPSSKRRCRGGRSRPTSSSRRWSAPKRSRRRSRPRRRRGRSAISSRRASRRRRFSSRPRAANAAPIQSSRRRRPSRDPARPALRPLPSPPRNSSWPRCRCRRSGRSSIRRRSGRQAGASLGTPARARGQEDDDEAKPDRWRSQASRSDRRRFTFLKKLVTPDKKSRKRPSRRKPIRRRTCSRRNKLSGCLV